jgi:hypothetical protein
MGKAVYNLGGLVWIVGVLLILGNVTRVFATFPFAGFLTTIVGVVIQRAGSSMIQAEQRATVVKVNQLCSNPLYTAAAQMAIEDANKQGAYSEFALERATAYLVDNGVPPTEARQNLEQVLAMYAARAKG